jgi:large subunit ribosomal protein L13
MGLQKTHTTKREEIRRRWHLVDAKDRVLGRVAAEVSQLLRGKHKPYFVPHLDVGDFVVVVNAKDVQVTGKKRRDKKYYRHSGYPGGLKTETFEELIGRRPTEVIRKAVWGMMPKNRLGRQMMKKLRVYAGADHPHADKIKKAD